MYCGVRRFGPVVIGMIVTAIVAGVTSTARASSQAACEAPTLTAVESRQKLVDELRSRNTKGWTLTPQGAAILAGQHPQQLDSAVTESGRGGLIKLSYGGPGAQTRTTNGVRTPQARTRVQNTATAWLFCNYGDAGNALFTTLSGTYTARASEHAIWGADRTVTLGTQACSVVESPCLFYALDNPNENWSVTSIWASGPTVYVTDKWCSYD